MPVKLNSSGGGSVTLTTPSTATDYTATFPAATGSVVLSNTSGTATVTDFYATNVYASGTVQMGSSFKRNRIVNGNFAVDQRNSGAASNIIASASAVYGIDRWTTAASIAPSGTLTIQRVSGDSTSYYAGRIARSSGTYAGALLLWQTIETINCADLAGQSVTLSFRARKGSGYGASLVAYVTTGTGTDQAAIGAVTGAWTGWASTTVSLTGTLGTSFSTFSGTVSIPSNATEVCVYFSTGNFSGTGGANDYLDISNVQLEVGSVATPYERQIYSNQLIECMRYYYRTTGGSGGYAFLGTGRTINATYGDVVYVLPTTMRATPSLGYSSLSHLQTNYGTLNTFSIETTNTSTNLVNSLALYVGPGSATVGLVQILQFQNSSGWVDFSAEL